MGQLTILISLLLNFSFDESIISRVNSYCTEIKGKTFNEILYVSVSKQKMYHIIKNNIVNEYPVSTSKKGVGNKKNSFMTPYGLHYIREKHGSETPLNGRMVGRVFYGQIATIHNDSTSSKTDDITTRILWLSGMEKNVNKGGNLDSYNRYIYIHGTSEEGKIGTPVSNGCIRMLNNDIIELYNNVDIGTKILILVN